MWNKIKYTLGYFRRKGFHFGNPNTDWIVILFCSLFLTLGIFLVSSYAEGIPIRDESVENIDVSDADKQSFLNEKVLKEVLDFYQARKQKTDDLMANPPKLVDPSL